MSCSGDEAEWLDAAAQGMPDQDGTRTGSDKASQANGRSVRAKELEGLSGDSDVLLVPKLETADGEPTSPLLGCLVLIIIADFLGNTRSSIKVQGLDTLWTAKMQMHQHCVECLHSVLGATWVGLWCICATGQGGLAGREHESSAGLSSSHQALLLGQAGLVQKGTSADELRQWRMAPYLDAVLRQPLSRFPIRLSAQLLRCAAPRSFSC